METKILDKKIRIVTRKDFEVFVTKKKYDKFFKKVEMFVEEYNPEEDGYITAEDVLEWIAEDLGIFIHFYTEM